MALLDSLSSRSFALLWSGQTLSRLGDSIYRVALAWWVLEKTGSAQAMGTVLIFSFTPMVLFSLLGGVACDRLPRTQVMLASDLLRGAVVCVVALLAACGLLEVWHVYVASLVFGFVEAFFQPAYASLVPDITPPDSLPSANALTSLSKQATSIIGPAVSALVVKSSGTSIAFMIDAASYFVSAACLLPLLRMPTLRLARTEQSSRPSVLGDLRGGLGTVSKSPWLWITITIAALSNITLSGPINIALPTLIKDHLQADVGSLGIIYSMIAVGSCVGTVGIGRLKRLRRRGPVAYVALVALGLSVLMFGLPISLAGVALAAMIGGASVSVFTMIWISTLQETVPRELLGRVSSIDNLGSYVLLPVGYGVVGWATDQIGATLVFVAGGAISAGLALIGLASPAIRRMD